jgi:hypothetical protein
MSTNKKIETILSLIEICEVNLKNAKSMLSSLSGNIVDQNSENKNSSNPPTNPAINTIPRTTSQSSSNTGATVMEGYFDGENMIGDDANTYSVPQNYASKSQLVIGDRLKWMISTNFFGETSEVFKLLVPVPKDRIIGKFIADNNSYAVIVNGYKNPIKILKASATYAMKNLNLKIGDNVAIYIPKIANPAWGAFIGVYNQNNAVEESPLPYQERKIISSNNDNSDNFVIEDTEKSYF